MCLPERIRLWERFAIWLPSSLQVHTESTTVLTSTRWVSSFTRCSPASCPSKSHSVLCFEGKFCRCSSESRSSCSAFTVGPPISTFCTGLRCNWYHRLGHLLSGHLATSGVQDRIHFVPPRQTTRSWTNFGGESESSTRVGVHDRGDERDLRVAAGHIDRNVNVECV